MYGNAYIEIPDKDEKTLADLVEQLGGKVISGGLGKKSTKLVKKQQILSDLEESVKWIELHQEGKVQSESIQQLLNKL